MAHIKGFVVPIVKKCWHFFKTIHFLQIRQCIEFSLYLGSKVRYLYKIGDYTIPMFSRLVIKHATSASDNLHIYLHAVVNNLGAILCDYFSQNDAIYQHCLHMNYRSILCS